MRVKGKITYWKDERGFGFITPNNSEKQIFVHIKAFNNKNTPKVNQLVSYTLSTDKQGRPCAEKVTRASDLPSNNKQRRYSFFSFIFPVLFIVFLGIGAPVNKMDLLVLPTFRTPN